MPARRASTSSSSRSITVGGDAIGSLLVTGDRNRIFLGAYESLRDAYIDPGSVFKRVEVDRFVGREWLLDEVDRFLRERDRGFFVVEAQAGLGKTAFLAYLVRQRHYIHHFVETARGPSGVEPALKNLAAQLMVAGELVKDTPDAILPSRAAERPDFLANLLGKVADKQVRTRGKRKLVVVVDGLDEAGTPAGQNVLGLPDHLPAGTYFVVSKRPVDVTLDAPGVPRRVIELSAESADNLRDMRRYLELAASRTPGARVLPGPQAKEAFVAALLAKSQGVWVYLHYVLAEVAARGRSRRAGQAKPPAFDIAALPNGLWEYYARFWKQWRDAHHDWDTLHAPLLSTLAAVQEDPSLDFLCSIVGAPNRVGVRRLLGGQWRAFVTVQDPRNPRYGLYHSSLREFLQGRTGDEELRIDQREFVAELADASVEAHSRISDYFLDAWGGLEDALPGLDPEATTDEHHQSAPPRYASKYLAVHLARAGRSSDLTRLIEQRTWYVTQRSFDPTRRSYARDVETALLSAEADGIGGLARVGAGSVLSGTLIGLASNVPMSAVRCLARLGRLEEATRHAELVDPPERQAQSFQVICEEWLRRERSGEAHAAALMAVLAAERVTETVPQAVLLAELAPLVARCGDPDRARAMMSPALDLVRDPQPMFYEFASIAAALQATGDDRQSLNVLATAIRVTEPLKDGFSGTATTAREDVLLALARSQSQAPSEDLLGSLASEYERARFLVMCADAASESGSTARLAGIAAGARRLDEPSERALALSGLGRAYGRIGETHRAELVLRKASDAADQEPDLGMRTRRLAVIAAAYAGLPDRGGGLGLLSRATAFLDPLKPRWKLLAAIGGLADAAGELGDERTLRALLPLARSANPDDWTRDEILSRISRGLAEVGNVTEAFAASDEVSTTYLRSRALADIAHISGGRRDMLALATALEKATEIPPDVLGLESAERDLANAIGQIAAAMAAIGDASGLRRARSACASIGHLGPRLAALSSVAVAFVDLGDTAEADDVLVEILASEQIDPTKPHVGLLTALAAALHAGGSGQEASKAIAAALVRSFLVTSPHDRASALAAVATTLGRLGERDRLRRLAVEIPELLDAPYTAEPFEAAFHAMATLNDQDGLRAAADRLHHVESDYWRASALISLADAAAIASMNEVSAIAASRALDIVPRLKDPSVNGASLINKLAPILEHTTNVSGLKRALDVTQAIDVPTGPGVDYAVHVDNALLTLAPSLALVAETDSARRAVARIANDERRAEANARLAGALAATGLPDEAFEVLDQLPGSFRDNAMSNIVAGFVSKGEFELASEVIDKIDHAFYIVAAACSWVGGVKSADRSERARPMLMAALDSLDNVHPDDLVEALSLLAEVIEPFADATAASIVERTVESLGMEAPEAFAAAGRLLALIGHRNQAYTCLGTALDLTMRIPHEPWREAPQSMIAAALVELCGPEDEEAGRLIARTCMTARQRGRAEAESNLARIVPALAKMGVLEELWRRYTIVESLFPVGQRKELVAPWGHQVDTADLKARRAR